MDGMMSYGWIVPAATGGGGETITIYVPGPTARFRARFTAPRFRARMQVR
jgi:hypothetical protein